MSRLLLTLRRALHRRPRPGRSYDWARADTQPRTSARHLSALGGTR